MIETEAGTESTYSFDHRLKRFKKKAADTLSASFAFILLRFFESYDKLKYFILGQPVTPQISKNTALDKTFKRYYCLPTMLC